jgi:cell division protein FtsA
MAKKQLERDLIVGIDIGTSKIVTIVGEISDDGKVHVIGIGQHPSRGLKRGVVVNIESTVQSIQRAVEEAELMAGCQINSAYTGIAGSHIRGLNSHGIVAIRGDEVTQYDIDRVIDAARALAIPADQKILHLLPQEYIIDNQDGIREPIGMSGVRLEGKVHVVTGAVSAAQNIIKCVERCGLSVSDVILEQLASSYAVLTEDEKELGVCMIDIGGGTTDIALFTEGAIRFTSVIPIAGDQMTNDIAVALRTPTQNAEAIKVKYASVDIESVSDSDMIEVPTVGRRKQQKISRKSLAEICKPRYEELFMLARNEIRRSGLEDLMPSGVVITGGGSQMQGVEELAEGVFQMPVRVGYPQKVTGLTDVVKNPIYATGVGLLLYGHNHDEDVLPTKSLKSGSGKGLFGRMKGWFQGNF